MSSLADIKLGGGTMFITIMLISACILGWGMVYISLREKGCNWFMVSGYLTLSKEERAKYKAKYDVIALNRYSGKMIYLPMAVWITLLVIQSLGFAWANTGWFNVVIVVGALIMFVSTFAALPKILGTRFEVKPGAEEPVKPETTQA